MLTFLILLTSVNFSLDSGSISPNSILHSLLLKPLYEYAYTTQTLHKCVHTYSLKFPQFCSLGKHCSGKDPWCSPYLLQVILPSSSLRLGYIFWLYTYQEANLTLG